MQFRWTLQKLLFVVIVVPAALCVLGRAGSAGAAPPSWTFLGLGGRHVRAIEIEGSYLYAGSETGLYRKPLGSLDTLWTPTPLDSVGVLSLLALDDTTMLATAEWYPPGSDYPDYHLYRSHDQGLSWSRILTSELKYGYRMHLSANPGYPDTVYLAQTPTIKSTDAGFTWSPADPLPSAFGTRNWLEISPMTPGTVWLGGESGYFSPTLSRSEDGGVTWPYSTQPPSSSENAVRCIRVDPLDDTRIYLGMEGFLDRSTNDGASWQIVYSLQSYWFSDIAVDPQHPDRLVATGNSNTGCPVQHPSLVVSVNGGSYWSVIENGAGPSGFLGEDVALTVESGKTVTYLAGTGVYRVDDAVTTAVPDVPISESAPRLFPPILRSGSVVIRFRTQSPGHVRLTILDALGRRVRTFVRESEGSGEEQVLWKTDDDAGRKVAEGIYILRWESGCDRLAQKLPVIRR
jgi:hypothetical protein